MGCKVKTNRAGYLAFSLFFNGNRTWEGTGLEDTAENRQVVEAQAVVISREIRDGRFSYLKWFPHGNRAHLFDGVKPAASPHTVRSYFEQWIQEKAPPLVRRSLERDYRQHFNTYILPKLGERFLGEVSSADIKVFRSYLLQEIELSIKTAKNIISGSLKAFFRDALVDQVIEKDPFFDLPRNNWWPQVEREDPDPFSEEERDEILKYFLTKRPHCFYAFLFTLFWEGLRPSEAVALRWGRIDLARATMGIASSRYLGAEASPKTRPSRRTIQIFPKVVEILETIRPLRPGADDYVFVDQRGNPIDQGEFGRYYFQGALRALGMRPRKFYNTRHTFVSVCLTHGVNPKWIAEHCGTSLRMIEEHYGKYIGNQAGAVVASLIKAQRENRRENFTPQKIKANEFSWFRGGPNGIRTRVTDVRGRCPNH